MILKKLEDRKLISCPKWLIANTNYLTVMGSVSYGVSNNNSDVDIYGFCTPPRDLVFPHLVGEIPGFGRQIQRFDQWQQHHVKAPDGHDYDFQVFGIVKYFQLCMECNPNMIDSLFTPRRCIIYSTQIGELVRENRKLFLHKGAWHKFRGYAYSQMHKIKAKINSSNESRADSITKFGYDVKFAYHVIRLLDECEQIMIEGDLDLERNREQLKSVRRGEWTLEQIEQHFEAKERHLEAIYAASTLQHSPDEERIKQVLLQCLEMSFGSLSQAIKQDPDMGRLIRELSEVLARYSEPTTEKPSPRPLP